MSLITRCSACGTMFKVVADQLRISQGWVRCGSCSEVFDAAANLQPYVSPAAVVSPSAADSAEAVKEEADRPESVVPMLVTPSADPQSDASKPVIAAGEALPATPVSLPEVQVSPSPDLAADVFAFSVSPEPSDFSGGASSATRTTHTESAFGEAELPQPAKVQEVSFVRDARREAFWRRPALRWTLGLASCFLLGTLLVQIALFQRNTLSVSQPWLKPALYTLCSYLGCKIAPPQQIEAIVIESSSFNKLAADVYRLKVVIRNSGAIALALPSLELTLTDTQDQAQLRRVLTPVEFGAKGSTLGAGAEFSGVLAIRISNAPADPALSPVPPASPAARSGPLRIAGYRVLAFYP